ncbi:MAG TPA: ABC transporter ATP-binding protein [Beijerinckiaceae bacterium]
MNGVALDVRGVSKRFQGFTAVDQVSFSIARGERRALIGPNGAGKTTLFNLVSGRLTPDGGDVVYEGRSVLALAPSAVCRLGIARTFQITSVFPRLTALENVQTSLFARNRRSHWLFRGAARVDREEAMERLAEVGVAPLAHRPAGSLSYGDQKRLELAMVMALKPRLLLLDEPTAGVDVNTRRALVELINDLCRREGLSLLFCEHDMDAVFAIADRITVLHQGRILTEGAPGEVQANPQVRSIYLGARHETRA